MRGAALPALRGGDRVTGVDLADGRQLPADVVVVGIGGVPNIEWLRGSRPRTGQRRASATRAGQTPIPNVVAVGDCAAWHDAVRRAATPGRALDRRARTAGHRRRHAARRRASIRVRRPDPRTSGPTSTARASSSPASPVPTTRSPSRTAAATSPASSPRTGATVDRSRSSASTSRACSPAGVVNSAPSRPRPDPNTVRPNRRHTQRRSTP